MTFSLCIQAYRKSSGRKCTKVDPSGYFWEKQGWGEEREIKLGQRINGDFPFIFNQENVTVNFLGIKINNFFLREKEKRRWKEEEAMMT